MDPKKKKKIQVQVADVFFLICCKLTCCIKCCEHLPPSLCRWIGSRWVAHQCTWLVFSLRWKSSSTWNGVALERFPEGWKYTLIEGQLLKSEGRRYIGHFRAAAAWGLVRGGGCGGARLVQQQGCHSVCFLSIIICWTLRIRSAVKF